MARARVRSGPASTRSRALLWLKVQADAFRQYPLRYLRAVGWRMRGLRVRSRNAIAPLAGRSPSAYAYWIAVHERALAPSPAASNGGKPVLIVIDCRHSSQGLADSLASVPSYCEAVAIGPGGESGIVSVATPAELKRLVPPDGRWILAVECGDRLAPNAVPSYLAEAADKPDARIIYADDDLIDESGERCSPHFKPDWNPELFECHDFVTGACIVRVAKEQVARLPAEGWAEALVRSALADSSVPIHVPQVLHHRRRRPQPIVPGAIEAPPPPDAPTVTAIVPTRDQLSLLRKCIEGLQGTDYPALEIIVVDNESREPATRAYLDELSREGVTVLGAKGPFNFSKINNFAVRHATGTILCFLNNDVEMVEPNWLWPLVRQAIRPDIGAVGARLLYPDGTIQHAGVFTGIGGGAAHAHRYQRRDEPGYFERSRLPQRVSAVTGACLVVAKEKFESVGGFDEQHFAVAFNDVDLCLKLNSRGWQSFYEPRSTLVHHESKSRGSDRLRRNRRRFAEELAALKRKWGTDVQKDPYHHPHLSPFSEQFVIGV